MVAHPVSASRLARTDGYEGIQMAADANGLPGLDTAMLEPMVRDLLDEPAAVVAGGWSCRPLGGGGGEGIGLYRVTGSARVGGH